MLAIKFVLGYKLHISPLDLDQMDYQEVVYLNDELIQLLTELKNKRK